MLHRVIAGVFTSVDGDGQARLVGNHFPVGPREELAITESIEQVPYCILHRQFAAPRSRKPRRCDWSRYSSRRVRSWGWNGWSGRIAGKSAASPTAMPDSPLPMMTSHCAPACVPDTQPEVAPLAVPDPTYPGQRQSAAVPSRQPLIDDVRTGSPSTAEHEQKDRHKTHNPGCFPNLQHIRAFSTKRV